MDWLSLLCRGCLGPGATHEEEKLLARCGCGGGGVLENQLGYAPSPLWALPYCQVAQWEGRQATSVLGWGWGPTPMEIRQEKPHSLGDISLPLSILSWIGCPCAGMGYPQHSAGASSFYQIAFCLWAVCTCVCVCVCS